MIPSTNMTKWIYLSRGYATLVDDDIELSLKGTKWCVKPHGKTAYAIRRLRTGVNKQTTMYLHHFVVGHPLNGKEVDHIDGNGLNNTRANLRIVTHTQNMGNTHLGFVKSSQYLGVYWDKSRSKWASR